MVPSCPRRDQARDGTDACEATYKPRGSPTAAPALTTSPSSPCTSRLPPVPHRARAKRPRDMGDHLHPPPPIARLGSLDAELASVQPHAHHCPQVRNDDSEEQESAWTLALFLGLGYITGFLGMVISLFIYTVAANSFSKPRRRVFAVGIVLGVLTLIILIAVIIYARE